MFTNSFKEAHYTNLYLDFIEPNETTSSRLDIQDKKIDSQDTKLEDLATKINTIVENTMDLKVELNKRVLELKEKSYTNYTTCTSAVRTRTQY